MRLVINCLERFGGEESRKNRSRCLAVEECGKWADEVFHSKWKKIKKTWRENCPRSSGDVVSLFPFLSHTEYFGASDLLKRLKLFKGVLIRILFQIIAKFDLLFMSMCGSWSRLWEERLARFFCNQRMILIFSRTDIETIFMTSVYFWQKLRNTKTHCKINVSTRTSCCR